MQAASGSVSLLGPVLKLRVSKHKNNHAVSFVGNAPPSLLPLPIALLPGPGAHPRGA